MLTVADFASAAVLASGWTEVAVVPAGFVDDSSGLLTVAGFATEAAAEALPCAAAAGFAGLAVGVFGASLD